MTLAVSKAILKIGAAGSAVYYTVAKGVWSSASESAQAYEDLKTYVVPQVSETVEQLPVEARLKWNECVKSSFARFHSISPATFTDAVNDTLKKAGFGGK